MKFRLGVAGRGLAAAPLVALGLFTLQGSEGSAPVAQAQAQPPVGAVQASSGGEIAAPSGAEVAAPRGASPEVARLERLGPPRLKAPSQGALAPKRLPGPLKQVRPPKVKLPNPSRGGVPPGRLGRLKPPRGGPRVPPPVGRPGQGGGGGGDGSPQTDDHQKAPSGGEPTSPSPAEPSGDSVDRSDVQGSGDRDGSSGSEPRGKDAGDGVSAAERRAARVRLAARVGAESAAGTPSAPAAGSPAEDASSEPDGSPAAPTAGSPAADASDSAPVPAAAPAPAATADDSPRADRSPSGGASNGGGDEGGDRGRRTSLMLISGIPIELLLALVAVVLTACGLAIGLLRERGRYRDAEREALTDPLTGLANRIAFEHQLAIDWQRAARYGRPLGMLVLDLDGFKQVNDTQGHAAGDRVLCRVADAIASNVRGGDVAARLGGDEFVVLAAETPASGLRVLAGRLSAAVEQLGASVSVGWAEREPGDDSPSEVLDRADQAMYEDKARANGRRPRAFAGSVDG